MSKKIFTTFMTCLLIISVSIFPENTFDSQAKQIKSITDAKSAARKKVPSASVTEVETDSENGVLVYEVSLHKKNKEYNLKFRASDGKLIEYDWEIPNTSYSIQNKKNISKAIIKKKAKNLIKNGKVKSLRLVIDDGLSEYKLSLTKGNRRYKLVYNAKSGKLLEYEWKQAGTAATASNKYIGQTKAQKIARKKVPGATIVKCSFDNDDGTAVYEIEMRKGVYEYELKINAKTGAILEFEKDIDD